MTLSVGIGTGGASAIAELEILLGAAGLSLTGMNVYGSIRGIMVANEMKEASTTMHEAKLQNNYLKQVMETLDYVLKTYIPSEACVNLMEAIKYTSRFEEHKRDLEFKEERKDADVMVARKYLYDRKYKLDSVILNEFSREHGKEVDTAIVHLGMYADEYTRSLNALAITIGMDIFFRNGAYRPETEEGRKILAHELTHVAQSKKREEYRGASREELEREAEAVQALFLQAQLFQDYCSIMIR